MHATGEGAILKVPTEAQPQEVEWADGRWGTGVGPEVNIPPVVPVGRLLIALAVATGVLMVLVAMCALMGGILRPGPQEQESQTAAQ